MPSFQSQIIRRSLQVFMGAQSRRLENSVEGWRALTDRMSRLQVIPREAQIEALDLDGLKAEWVRAPGVEGEAAVLYLHGGGFICGSMAGTRELAAQLSAAARARFLVIDYRLAPEHPFPAALQDALRAYQWLLDQGYDARKLVIGGDSAGGGLALQALHSLRQRGDPLPCAAFFLSPYTDMVHFDGESYRTRHGLDPMLTLEICRLGGSKYVGDNDPQDPLLSPVRMDPTGLPPFCIHVGDLEVLLSDSTRLAERAQQAGVPVEIKVWEGLWHVFQTTYRWVPEARQSVRQVGAFVQAQLQQVVLAVPQDGQFGE